MRLSFGCIRWYFVVNTGTFKNAIDRNVWNFCWTIVLLAPYIYFLEMWRQNPIWNGIDGNYGKQQFRNNEESFGRNVLLILSTHFLYPSERRAKWDKQSDPFKMKRIVESTFLSWPCIYFPFLNLVLVPDSNQTLLRSSSYQQELGLLWRIPPRWWVVSCSSPCLQSNVLEINQIVCCLRAERL